MNKKLQSNWKDIINECVNYFGKHNNSIIEEKANKLKVVVVPRTNDKIEFLGDAPLCIKKDSNRVILTPESLFSNVDGNYLFVNQLVRAITEDTFKVDHQDIFNSSLINIITNDICSKLEEKEINLTNCDYPNYKIETFYDNFIGPVNNFYISNKQSVLDAMLKKNVKLNDKVKEVISRIEDKAEKHYEEQVERLEEYSLAFNKKR